MSNFSTLEIGKRALLAQRFGLDVTSNNIANVNTPGYSRRQAVLSETDPRFTTSGYIGTGVLADRLRSFREEFFDKEIRSNISRQSSFEFDELIFQRMEAIFSEPSDMGINELMTQFYGAFEDLAMRPEDVPLREHLLSVTKTLVDRFHSVSSKLQQTRDDVLKQMELNTGEVNKLLKGIAELNSKIVSTKSLAGNEAQTYVDQREQLIEDLNKLVGSTVAQGDNGSVNVFINGISMVTGNVASTLHTDQNVDAATGEITVSLSKTDASGAVTTRISPESGELSSQLKHYNITLNALNTTTDISISQELDRFVNALAEEVNGIMTTGYGLDDAAGAAPGRNFFDSAGGPVTASSIIISDDVLGNPRDIPLAGAGAEPGNNQIALAVSRLSIDNSFLDDMTPSDFLNNMLGQMANIGREASAGGTTTGIILEQLENQRESVIGVNLDEEAVNLIKFQKAFEASSRVINITNEMLTTLVNLGR